MVAIEWVLLVLHLGDAGCLMGTEHACHTGMYIQYNTGHLLHVPFVTTAGPLLDRQRTSAYSISLRRVPGILATTDDACIAYGPLPLC